MNSALVPAVVDAATSTTGLAVTVYLARRADKGREKVEKLKWIREAVAADVAWIARWLELDGNRLEHGVDPRDIEVFFSRILLVRTLGSASLAEAAEALKVSVALAILDLNATKAVTYERLLVDGLGRQFGTPDRVHACGSEFLDRARVELGL